jgi:hypothetical protein
MAAERGHLKCVKLLIEHGAKITVNAIVISLWNGRYVVAEYLINQVLEDPQYDKHQIIDYHIVNNFALVNRIDILMKLVRHRIQMDPYLLYTSVYDGRYKVSRWLLQIGCPTDYKSVHSNGVYHYSSLYEAIEKRDQELVDQLIEAGAKMFVGNSTYALNYFRVDHTKNPFVCAAEKYGIDVYSKSHVPPLITLCLRVINFSRHADRPLVDIPPWFPPILYTGGL